MARRFASVSPWQGRLRGATCLEDHPVLGLLLRELLPRFMVLRHLCAQHGRLTCSVSLRIALVCNMSPTASSYLSVWWRRPLTPTARFPQASSVGRSCLRPLPAGGRQAPPLCLLYELGECSCGHRQASIWQPFRDSAQRREATTIDVQQIVLIAVCRRQSTQQVLRMHERASPRVTVFG